MRYKYLYYQHRVQHKIHYTSREEVSKKIFVANNLQQRTTKKKCSKLLQWKIIDSTYVNKHWNLVYGLKVWDYSNSYRKKRQKFLDLIYFLVTVKDGLLGQMTWRFLNVLELFSPEKRKYPIFAFIQSYFQQKRAPKLSVCHLLKKSSAWVFGDTNRQNGFYYFSKLLSGSYVSF